LAQLQFNEEKLARVVEKEDVLATDIADELVRRGVPFREAHGAVGRLLRLADSLGKSVNDLPDASWTEVHPAFGKGSIPHPTAERSVEARQIAGGTGRNAVLQQIAEAERLLQ
jgi:argininosuccinate lyase